MTIFETCQFFIFYTIRQFGTVIFVIIMSTRAIPQVFLSWILFDNKFGPYGWIGIGIVFFTISLRVGHSIRKCRKKYLQELARKSEHKDHEKIEEDLGLIMNSRESCVKHI